jgi:hypothetical protein
MVHAQLIMARPAWRIGGNANEIAPDRGGTVPHMARRDRVRDSRKLNTVSNAAGPTVYNTNGWIITPNSETEWHMPERELGSASTDSRCGCARVKQAVEEEEEEATASWHGGGRGCGAPG